MPITFKKGDTVRQVVPVVEGKVENLAIVDGEVQFLVSYVDKDGETSSRYFKEDELTAVPADPAAE